MLQQLQEAVALDPMDPLPRRVLADWYEDHGEDDLAKRQRKIASLLLLGRGIRRTSAHAGRVARGLIKEVAEYDLAVKFQIGTEFYAEVRPAEHDALLASSPHKHAVLAPGGGWLLFAPSPLPTKILPGYVLAKVGYEAEVIVHPDDCWRYSR